MVTVEQGGGLEQAGSASTDSTQSQSAQNLNFTQTQGSLQNNSQQSGNFQNVVSGSNLFNSAPSAAIVTITGTSGTSAEQLLASEKAPTSPQTNNTNHAIVWAGLVLVVVLFLAAFVLQTRKTTTK